MNLYLIPNDPEQTTLVSANGVAQYRVLTSKAGALRSPAVTRITRPADSAANAGVAEVEWRRWGAHPVVRTHVFDGEAQTLEVRELLYKLGSTFSTARYFLGNDNEEYRWKYAKGSGYVLSLRSTGEEVARHTAELVKEGYFKGERQWVLKIRPGCDLDIDIIVLTFVILEKRRRDKLAKQSSEEHGEEPCEGGIEMSS
ncbi:uncharacterized protein PHACADRAFT_256916 [Phanerochaete carnosa HHB-10118-sp]|uniref:DUF6593 domain-containing protein n=1 Tax=Phanerochaete carnosa (strain HHB-10118-sp) TaxID=650164 RepID=K5WZL8_PHACS|nr:uncharacterized protein PHACADRAFT_256916 [Phanerochaete carnosa HHB-10118-sp]EKM55947.1 hypothetical protein PHACADRAFT_256916 [Phanerochaete carnosa HHB-10118-sp]